MGECNQETAEGILDFFYQNGGNFIDTFVMSYILSRFMADTWLERTTTKKGIQSS